MTIPITCFFFLFFWHLFWYLLRYSGQGRSIVQLHICSQMASKITVVQCTVPWKHACMVGLFEEIYLALSSTITVVLVTYATTPKTTATFPASPSIWHRFVRLSASVRIRFLSISPHTLSQSYPQASPLSWTLASLSARDGSFRFLGSLFLSSRLLLISRVLVQSLSLRTLPALNPC